MLEDTPAKQRSLHTFQLVFLINYAEEGRPRGNKAGFKEQVIEVQQSYKNVSTQLLLLLVNCETISQTYFNDSLVSLFTKMKTQINHTSFVYTQYINKNPMIYARVLHNK